MEIDKTPRSPAESAGSRPEADDDDIVITVTYRNNPVEFAFDPSATIADLADAIEADLNIPAANQKLLVAKHGLQKPPFKNPDLALATLAGVKIQLLAPSNTELSSLQAACSLAKARSEARARHRHRGTRARKSGATMAGPSIGSSDTYTFLSLRPLAGLPHPERSMAFLERLRDDPGIRAAMRKHRFTVGLLTEMEPLANTSHSHEGTSRLLGLNRNKGEAIELRLRTDAHDGYRDYKTVRNTLCHELAHNVHSPHDRNFWDLCHQIEREVDQLGAGRSMADGQAYAPARERADEEEDYPPDHGGWEGGEFVLGGGNSLTPGLNRRDILAQAATERMRKQNLETPDGKKPGEGRPPTSGS